MLVLNTLSQCVTRQMAKSHQLPYSVSTSVSTHPLELIASDVWGPAPISMGQYTYYVSFIDDFSKFTWIYLIKKKSDVLQVFQEFQQMVERKFERKIKTVQSDWGGEYEKLHSFFRRIGIIHHVSCPHAHQQNGIAERKHRHIVEVGLALLANAGMPQKYWGHAFLTAAHLINMLPSKILNFDTPHERLLHEKPDYSFLRVFGCACWPNLRPYNAHKLAFRSIQCVFLGYSTLHKGYKCLDLDSGRIYISRDVIFDEDVFPFSKLHPNAGPRLRQEINLLPSHLLNSGGVDCIANDTNISVEDSACVQDPGMENYPEDVAPDVFQMQHTDPLGATDPRADSPALQPVPDQVSSAPIEADSPASDGPSTHGGLPSGPAPAPASQIATAAPDNGGFSNAQGSGASSQSSPAGTTEAPPAHHRTRSTSGIVKPKIFTDGTVRWLNYCATGEPTRFHEALNDPKWKQAMTEEYSALIKNKTWHLVEAEKGSNLIDCK